MNIESGSASHLDFVVWYMWVQEQYGDEVASRIKALVGGTTDEEAAPLGRQHRHHLRRLFLLAWSSPREGVDPAQP